MEIDLSVLHEPFAIDGDRLVNVAGRILADHGIQNGALSIAVVDDETIHRMNVESLNHDYPTDVLSYLFESRDGWLEGEIVVSSDTAKSRAAEFNMQPTDELTLYVIHGALHLVGFEDDNDEARLKMREMERRYLNR